ncbi:hypothetical protein [Streptomyces sp. NBC_00467]|uniref:hypothetical protein n=1 Tax=Streptomyces sp. NBC_00467 TaxID=2975752 RepID=UPI002E173532
MMLTLIVALAFGGAAVHAAYRNEKLGPAIVVGLTVVIVFYVVMDKDPSAAMPQTVAPSAPASPLVPTPTTPSQTGPPTS